MSVKQRINTIFDITESPEQLAEWLANQTNARGENTLDHITRRHVGRSNVSMLDGVVRKIDNYNYNREHNINRHENFSYSSVDRNFDRGEALTESTFNSQNDMLIALSEALVYEHRRIAEWAEHADQGETFRFILNIPSDGYDDDVDLKGHGITYDSRSIIPNTTDYKTVVLVCDRQNEAGFGVVTFFPTCDNTYTAEQDYSIDIAATMRKTYAFKNAQSKQEKHRLLGMCPDFQPPRERVNQSLLDTSPDDPTPGFNL